MYDKDNPEFWRNLNPKTIITLNDTQAIEESMEEGEGVKGIDYILKYILKIKQSDNLAEWLLLNLEGDEQDMWLVVKIVDQEMSLRVYYEAPEFEPGNRQDMIDREEYWLFQEPEDIDNFEVDELQFAKQIEHNVQEEDQEEEVLFHQKSQGEMYGTCTSHPPQSSLENTLATVVEYSIEQDYKNPELLVLEIGGRNGSMGGFIRLMLGAEINFSEVDVLPA